MPRVFLPGILPSAAIHTPHKKRPALRPAKGGKRTRDGASAFDHHDCMHQHRKRMGGHAFPSVVTASQAVPWRPDEDGRARRRTVMLRGRQRVRRCWPVPTTATWRGKMTAEWRLYLFCGVRVLGWCRFASQPHLSTGCGAVTNPIMCGGGTCRGADKTPQCRFCVEENVCPN